MNSATGREENERSPFCISSPRAIQKAGSDLYILGHGCKS